MSLLSLFEAVVCDLDGVVYRGPEAVPSAVAALNCAGRVVYATNNASRPPAVVADHLRSLGLKVSAEAVVNASQAGAWVLADLLPTGAPVLAVGGEGVGAALTERGFAVVSPESARSGTAVRGVLQGYGPGVTAADLAEAAYVIESGGCWVATNTDATLPTDRGEAPGNGALVGAVALAVRRQPDAVAGKPCAPLYLLAAERLAVPPERILAVGDRLETDIEGANRSGMRSVLVLTGVHDVHDAAAAPPERRPTWVVPDLSWLHTTIGQPERAGDGVVRCGAAQARRQGSVIEVSGPGVDRLNALLRLAWDEADAGHAADPGLARALDEALSAVTGG